MAHGALIARGRLVGALDGLQFACLSFNPLFKRCYRHSAEASDLDGWQLAAGDQLEAMAPSDSNHGKRFFGCE